MKTSKNRQTLQRLTLVVGILVAVLAGLHTTVYAEEDKTPSNSHISHQEMVDLLKYLWEDDTQITEPSATVYDYQFDLVFQGPITEMDDPQILFNGDVLMSEGNHTIYMLQTSN